MILLLCAALQSSHYIIFLVALYNIGWIMFLTVHIRPDGKTTQRDSNTSESASGYWIVFLMLTLVVHYPLFSI